MRIGDRIEVRSDWSSFDGQRGRVTQMAPYLMVVLDDDPRPIRIEEGVVFLVESERHIGGAE